MATYVEPFCWGYTWARESHRSSMAAAYIFLELLEVAKAIQHMHSLGIYLYQTIEGVRRCSILTHSTQLNLFVRMLLLSTQNPALEFRDAVYFCVMALTTASNKTYRRLGSFFTR